jgi:hypothetical protein
VRLGATGTLLGAFPDMTFDERTVSMGAGSLLFLYTDGLTEARCDGEFYGEERLFAHLATHPGGSAAAVVRGVVADVRGFSGDHLRDDLAILALRRAPGATRREAAAPTSAQNPAAKAAAAAEASAAKRKRKPKPKPTAD